MLDVALLSSNRAPSLDLNFLSGALDSRITFTRASSGWYFNSAGSLTSAATDAARFEYDPSTLVARGLLIEEARTNSLRNNSMTGAVVGTPGTLPTNWLQNNNTGLAANVIAFGTDHGLPYIDLRISGTTAAGVSNNIFFDANTAIAAVQNQAWTSSLYLSLSAGSLTNVSTIKQTIQAVNSGGTGLTSSASTNIIPTVASLSSQRAAFSFTLPDATTAFVRSFLTVAFSTAPVAVDLTLRIGAPQLELGATQTSAILTTTAAVTRAAETATMPLARFGSSGQTLVASAILPVSGANAAAPYAVIDDGTTNNQIAVYTSSALLMSLTAVSGGSTMITNSPASTTAGAVFTAGVSVAAGAQVPYANGTAGTSATSALYPIGITTLRIGRSSGSLWCNSYIRSIKAWPRALSATDLKGATA